MNSEADTVDLAIQRLVAQGAAILMRTDSTPIPVTWWRRVNAGRHFYFTTGDDTFAGHDINFAQERTLGEVGVEFRDRDGKLVAYLAGVDEQTDDPERAKSLGEQIQAWKAEFDSSPRLRAFVLAEYARSRAN